MGDEFIPDYSRYETVELIDVYKRIDKANNPKRTMAIENELRKKLNIDTILNFNDDSVKNNLDNYLETGKFEDKEKTKYEKKIRNGWIAGVVLATITLLLTIISLKSPDNSFLQNNFDKWSFFDVVIVYALSFGVHKKNKIAAIVLLVYFLLPKILGYIDSGNIKVLTGGSLFIYFFVEAIRAIIELQKMEIPYQTETNTV